MAVLFLLFAAGSVARAESAATCVLNMFEPIRSQALGGAGAAIGNDPTLARLNPSSITQVRATSLTMGGKRGYFGDLLGHIQLVTPFGYGVAHLGGMYFESPSVRLTASDGTERYLLLQQDLAVEAGYCGNPFPGFSCGATAKILNSRMFEEVSSRTLSFDAGFQYQALRFLKTGLAVRHAGMGLMYSEDPIPLPLEMQAGLAAGWMLVKRANLPGDSLLCVLDAIYPAQTHLLAWRAGLEYRLLGAIALRGGASLGHSNSLGRYSAGLGLQYGSLRLDYSLRFTGEFSNPNSLSVTITF
jgi:hypothetical protein